MSKLFFVFAALSGFSAVTMGAFASHGLRPVLSESLYSALQTGVSYQFYHTLALLAVAILSLRYRGVALTTSGIAFMLGICLFSGSLYLLALTQQKIFGPITPIGGVCLMVGWLSLAVSSRVVFNGKQGNE